MNLAEVLKFRGCIALYRFEGNANDASGAGNNGSAANVSYGLGYGKHAQGANFNGSNAKITLPDLLDGVTEITLGGWFNG
jgi:hypothetical protein